MFCYLENKMKNLYKLVIVFSFVLLFSSCPGTNNDQGRSFLASGFYTSSSGVTSQIGAIVPMFQDQSAITTVGGQDADGLEVRTFMGLSNLLSKQFIRVTLIECSYQIPGSTLVIPEDSTTVTRILNSTGTGTAASTGLPTTSNVEFPIVSTGISAFINVNQSSLPALPFRMNAFCNAVGVSEAGNVFRTNTVGFEVTYVDLTEGVAGITPVVGTGTGGTPDTFTTEQAATANAG